jgi:uncharacterized membrane-anchored protein
LDIAPAQQQQKQQQQQQHPNLQRCPEGQQQLNFDVPNPFATTTTTITTDDSKKKQEQVFVDPDPLAATTNNINNNNYMFEEMLEQFKDFMKTFPNNKNEKYLLRPKYQHLRL